MCDRNGSFIGEPDQNCTFLNCSEPPNVENLGKNFLVYIAERLAKCGIDSNKSVEPTELFDVMRKERELHKKWPEKTNSTMEEDVKTMFRVFDRLLDKDAVVWKEMKDDKRKRVSMEIIKETEETAWLMGCTEADMTLNRNNLAIEVFNLDNRSKTLELEMNSLSIGDVELPGDLVAQTSNLCHGAVQKGVVTAYRNMESYLPTDDRSIIGSGIVGVSLGNEYNTTYHLPGNKRIKIKLYHKEISDSFTHPVCVFLDWNYDKKNGKYGVWESEGCYVVTTGYLFTICECNHLTNFAILLNFAGAEPTGKDADYLNVLSLVFSCLSSVALVLTIVIFATIKSFHSRRNTITCNLAVCLLAMNILVQTGMERVDKLTVICKLISALLQYVVLSAFFWMLLEGILLYRMVILVFETKTVRLPALYGIAYGIPLLIVALSSSLRPDSMIRSKYCWPSQEKGHIWSITGPILLVIMVNVIIFGMTLNAASNIKKLSNISVENSKRNLIQRLKGMMSLMCVLGFTWLVGFFHVPNSVVAAYLFVIFNGLQGVLLFVTQIVLNDPARKKLFAIYKENMTKFSSASGTWNLLAGSTKSSKNNQDKNSKVTSGVCSSQNDQESSVQPSAPPLSSGGLYHIQFTQYKEQDEVHERHPFGVDN